MPSSARMHPRHKTVPRTSAARKADRPTPHITKHPRQNTLRLRCDGSLRRRSCCRRRGCRGGQFLDFALPSRHVGLQLRQNVGEVDAGHGRYRRIERQNEGLDESGLHLALPARARRAPTRGAGGPAPLAPHPRRRLRSIVHGTDRQLRRALLVALRRPAQHIAVGQRPPTRPHIAEQQQHNNNNNNNTATTQHVTT